MSILAVLFPSLLLWLFRQVIILTLLYHF